MARRKQGREVVYVERGGDASAKWLFWGAVLGAGLALLYAPRSGEETRRVLQRKLWKLLASALTFDALLAAIPFVLLVLIGLTHLAQAMAGPAVDPTALFHRFFPAHASHEGHDPFDLIKRLLVSVAQHRGQISLYAVPAFIWFSTRLFAGVRTSLNEIYDVSARPAPPRNFVLNWLSGKARDALMVVATVVLFLANTTLSTMVTIAWARGSERVIPQLAFFFSTVGRLLGELLTFGFSVSLFYVTYRYASVRRLPWRTALLASTFTA